MFGVGNNADLNIHPKREHPCVSSRWQLNGSDVDLGLEHRYELHGGDLVVVNPDRDRDAGSYQCFATNSVGTVVSREARLQFACKFWVTRLRRASRPWGRVGCRSNAWLH